MKQRTLQRSENNKKKKNKQKNTHRNPLKHQKTNKHAQ